jgi:acyl-CoA reductase-like NAD-dependent aldehyde dehydrogenase
MTPLITVPKSADLYYTESFGPSVSVFVVNTDEAIALANDTDFGLSSSVCALTISKHVNIGIYYVTDFLEGLFRELKPCHGCRQPD